MRPGLLIISLLLLGQLSCSDGDIDTSSTPEPSIPASFNDDPSITTLNGKWKVYSFENLASNTIEYKTLKNSRGQDIIVEFNDTKVPHGFSGIKTVNMFGGEFNYVGSRQFKLKEVISTLAGQPWWADEFDKFISYGLYNEATFIINDEMLRIEYDYKTKRVTLIKE
ncbi:MAG TPA: hypothetical protein VK589_26910 [Chryseolinea sp.]|nr:hypothetical protein [Chryseolinea sp.]